MNCTNISVSYKKRRKHIEKYHHIIVSSLLAVLATVLMLPIVLLAHTAANNDTEFVIDTQVATTIECETLCVAESRPLPTVVITPLKTSITLSTEPIVTAEAAYITEPKYIVADAGINTVLDASLHLASVVKPECTMIIEVDNIIVDINELMSYYHTQFNCDTMNRNDDSTINTCINFLYDQMNVSPEIVAGIIGNICVEGHFGEEQNTYKIATNVEEYINNLKSDKNKGYGIAQWTYQTRQEELAIQVDDVRYYLMSEYNLTYDECTYGEYYPTVIVLGELIHLYYELQEYEIFDSYNDYYTLEDATGRVALLYERYKNCKKHWTYTVNGECILIGSAECSGARRLNFAELIYERIIVN